MAEANKNGFEVAFLDRFPPYNGGLQALPWAPPWIGFPLTTVVSRCFPGRLPGPASPLQRWPPGASLGASLGRFPPYNGGIQAPRWAPLWVGFPLTTVASRRLPGRLPGFPGPPWASLGCPTPIPERLRSLTDLVHKRPFCGRPYRGVHSRPPPVHLSCTSRPPPVHLQSERAA